MTTSTYVTVAIPYVNAAPHLGYAYELVLADTFARARRQRGDDVRFLGGTDDYSLKNVLAAGRAGVPVAEFVRRHARRFVELADDVGVRFDDFIHTSADVRHRPAVERLWRACAERGDLEVRSYEGEYCVGCEQFWRGAELVVDARGRRCCPEHRTPVERVAEDNWFFRLSRYQTQLESLIATGTLRIHPAPFRDEVLAFVRAGLADISVSRSRARARNWGIGVPDDPDQVVYVWFDALTNYLSALGFGAPDSEPYRRWWRDADERVHVIGKGIVRFHAVYWPAFLLSAGIPLPTRIEIHPYLTVDGAKVSKSSPSAGPGLSPPAVVDSFGVDALRWWFASSVSPVADTDFTTGRLVAVANGDLAGGIGNAAGRVLTVAQRGGVPTDAPAGPLAGTGRLEEDVLAALGAFDLRGACGLITDAVDALNRDLEATQPWKLHGDELAAVLGPQLASLRVIAAALRPIAPRLSARLAERLVGHASGDPLFPRLTSADPGTETVTKRHNRSPGSTVSTA